MLRSQFEEDLEKLHNQFYAMGQEVLSQINRTVRAFVTHDRDLAKEVIEDDAEVNEYEVKLEKKSFEMIALQQPVSQDLRTVLTVLKAVSDLERMGDHAVSIAKAAIRMKGEQRICVARVLATSPKIILLDEPTSALDPISAGKIEETLYGLKDKYTMLLVTRSMQQASRISDKTGFFLDGDLIEFNDTKKMFLNPQHKETEDYISGKFG